MTEETIIRKAEFNPRVCSYWLMSGAIAFCVSVIGIPLLPFWFIFGFILTKRYLNSMECLLTNKALKVSKGFLVRVEKTIPLEKITDMGTVQGPIMRKFDLIRLTVETAGQSGDGALVSLTGIIDAQAFREAVLNQRENLSAPITQSTPDSGPMQETGTTELLTDIRDSLHRIEAILGNTGNQE